ncbi:MAG: hypothetical protein KKB30_01815 [Proteobacteria bacterium]|nr:hypothetical protein [Pseudomonadota bacterium]MBU1716331.1 hypothetical protein [Pseudomonadota bacterium]
MEFNSFDQALKICMTSEEESPEQNAALKYCIENAPPNLRKILTERFQQAHENNCGCGCHNQQDTL